MIKDCVILCLDKRKPLWQDLTRECQKRGWSIHQYIVGDGSDHDLRYNQFDKTEIDPNWSWGTGIGALRHYNAFLSHKAIIRYAIRKQLPNFLLLEDDAYPINNRFDAVMDYLDEDIGCRDIDLLYLGWHAFDFNGDFAVGYNLELERLWKEEGQCRLMPANFNVGGFHSVLINSSIYTQLINLPAICPMDSQVNRMSHLNRFMITPKVFHVRNTFSYCENKEVIREIL